MLKKTQIKHKLKKAVLISTALFFERTYVR